MANNFLAGSAILSLRWSLHGAQGFNVFGVVKPGGTVINQALANALGSAIKSAHVSSGLAPLQSTGSGLLGVGIRDWSTSNQAEFIDTGSGSNGTGVGDALPRQVAYCVTLRTALAGARYRGRNYIGGLTEESNDSSGSASAALQTAAVNFVVAIQSACQANGLTLGVLSRPSDRVVVQITKHLPDGTTEIDQEVREARPGAITPVVAIEGRNLTWDSQRRRAAIGSGSTLFANRLVVDVTSARSAPKAS